MATLPYAHTFDVSSKLHSCVHPQFPHFAHVLMAEWNVAKCDPRQKQVLYA